MSPKELTGGSNGEKSAAVRKRVEIARRRQAKRYKGTSFRYNSDVPGSQLSEFFAVTGEAERVASEYAERTNCTARGYHRMWKVARTIADLTDSEKVLPEHMAEAAGFRTEWR